ncbi:hypothetical protein ACQP1G_30210 [Nocardia sp. CA-107356]|uniref:hypothetical protein n=1 Tax=Nocardia sp. CA-107356 TaxID=3239972 RepID=UPI003D8DF455
MSGLARGVVAALATVAIVVFADFWPASAGAAVATLFASGSAVKATVTDVKGGETCKLRVDGVVRQEATPLVPMTLTFSFDFTGMPDGKYGADVVCNSGLGEPASVVGSTTVTWQGGKSSVALFYPSMRVETVDPSTGGVGASNGG